MDDVADFLTQMHLAALEETRLHEVARGSIDRLPGGDVVHGPWPVQMCAAVLHAWYVAGWIELYRDRIQPEGHGKGAPGSDDSDVLTSAASEDLFAHPHRWVIDHADGGAQLCLSDLGLDIPWHQWHDSGRLALTRWSPGTPPEHLTRMPPADEV